MLMRYQVSLVGLVFKLVENRLCILVTKKSKEAPSSWSLPSANLTEDLHPELLLSKFIGDLGVKVSYIEQLYTFFDGNSVNIAHIVLAHPDGAEHLDNCDRDIKWVNSKRIPSLEGIHNQIKEVGIQRLRNKISYSRIATRLLDEEFTLTELMTVYELILDEPIDKRNFRKKMESKNLVAPTAKYRHGTHRPAQLYRRGPKAKNVPL